MKQMERLKCRNWNQRNALFSRETMRWYATLSLLPRSLCKKEVWLNVLLHAKSHETNSVSLDCNSIPPYLFLQIKHRYGSKSYGMRIPAFFLWKILQIKGGLNLRAHRSQQPLPNSSVAEASYNFSTSIAAASPNWLSKPMNRPIACSKALVVVACRLGNIPLLA